MNVCVYIFIYLFLMRFLSEKYQSFGVERIFYFYLILQQGCGVCFSRERSFVLIYFQEDFLLILLRSYYFESMVFFFIMVDRISEVIKFVCLQFILKREKERVFFRKKRKKFFVVNLFLLYLYKFYNLYIKKEVEKIRRVYEIELKEKFFKKMIEK